MRAYSYTLILLNFYACTAFVQRASFSSNVHTSTDLIKNHVNGKRKFTGLHMSWFEGLVAKNSKKNFKPPTFIKILDVIGSGSYGIVHEAKFDDDSDDDSETSLFIAKRAWTIDELRKKQIKTHGSSDTESTQVVDEKALKGRAERCKYYLDVEQHCGEKISSSHTNETKVPRLLGKYKDSTDQHEWLLFELITRSKDDTRTARSLKAVMDLDWIDQHRADEHHHLYILQKELRMDDSATFEDTLDVILRGLLISIAGVHDINIAHRDIKPDNLLIDGENQEFVLIDFGSAQDVDVLMKMVFVLDGDATVALSPIYAAPECFIEWDKAPLNFDVFSTGLVFCQLLFNLLDDRTDAGFRQQLEDADFDMDLWLEREFQATLRPAGLEDGLEYLGNRPGLWGLLKRMLQKKPKKRICSRDALNVVREILSNAMEYTVEDRIEKDGSYFDYVIQDLDICALPDELDVDDEALGVRPLHFVATFDRDESIGLILAEADATDEDGDYKYEDEWQLAIASANGGDVFVRDFVVGGQAERIGVFEIGDRIAGVGEFPHQGSGFEGFVSMLEAVPQNSKTVKVHFDRKAERSIENNIVSTKGPGSKTISVVSHGAWSTKGRRKTQEDTFVLHEIQSGTNDILLSGVFDGHGGDSASQSAQQLLPVLLSSELGSNRDLSLKLALDTTWDSICESYREGCSLLGSGCLAEYDPREGILYASTGSKDLIPGCTATVSALRFDTEGTVSDLVVLNCGDSRTLVAGEPASEGSYLHFVTRDHVPSCPLEDKRLRADENFANPQCSMNKYWLKIGDYRYALSRSLEGSLATSKGIISKSDLFTINLEDLAMSRTHGIIIQASDGLFEVLDNEEVAKNAVAIRKEGLSAQECAKILCQMAVKKNTSDNVSVVVIYLE